MSNTDINSRDLADFAHALERGEDPFIENWIIPNIPKPKRIKEHKHFTSHKQNRRAQSFQARFQKQSDRGSLVIVRFLRDDGFAEFRLQRDFNDDLNEDGTKKLKGKPGFIFGSPDSKREPDEIVARRETDEEALIPDTVGKLEFVGNINVARNYYIAVFVLTVPFDTKDGVGEDVYSYDHYTKEEIQLLIKENAILFRHASGFNMAIAGGFI